MKTLENSYIVAKYYPNEYIMIVDLINTIIVKDNMKENWDIISKNFGKKTIIKDIKKMLSIN
jgi:hypothetical protein